MNQTSRLILSAILAGILCAGPIACSVDKVISAINAAAAIANAAGGILSSSSPEYGGLALEVGKDLSDLGKLYAAYEKTADTEKPGFAGQIHALTATVSANLSAIFTDGRIKNPGLQDEITTFVAVANSALAILLSQVPGQSVAASSARVNVQALPVVPNAKSAGDLKKFWNGAIGASHPGAMVK